jgi:hypothetical protein
MKSDHINNKQSCIALQLPSQNIVPFDRANLEPSSIVRIFHKLIWPKKNCGGGEEKKSINDEQEIYFRTERERDANR